MDRIIIKVRIIIFFAFILANVVACSGSSSVPVQQDDIKADSLTGLDGEAHDYKEPFSLSVAKEFNDGTRLVVVADVRANVDRQLETVLLRLKAYKDGTELGQTLYPLTKIAPTLSAGDIKEIPLVLSAVGVTDYQLDIIWGDESASYLSPENSKAISKVGLLLNNVGVSSERVNCKGVSCDLKFTISGELINLSTQVVKRATIGTGFIWIPQKTTSDQLDLYSKLPENEVSIDLNGLELPPGITQKVRLVLDQTAPERADGEFQPTIRVVSYQ